ncbi:type IV secretory system conjugative DNA transfer family protein [uncultured Jannaschia sp.]|uniref:type IV secretory system conjugative DNA transfer family protein n=1 Tax=uncultured Jannaschia sp. TaxID=293347 RepID=UPI0026292A09|nr:type IV secretory system conjugative DNA transfer family protein [uncultured Jannaschia sp.]
MMNLALTPRHWGAIAAALLLVGLGPTILPDLVPIFPRTATAFPLFGIALMCDTFGNAAESRRTLWKVLGWATLVAASLVALWPLGDALSDMAATYRIWNANGWPLPRAAWEAIQRFELYSEIQRSAMLLAFAIGLMGIAAAIALPLAPLINPRVGKDRAARSGPWRAGWMAPADVARLARNRTGLPLAHHEGRLLRYAKDDAKGWRGGHHLVVSGTRGGKGVSAVIPAILDHRGPVVALDIKGENFAVTRRHRQSLGRHVAVLNPFGIVEPSADQFNPLDYIRPDELARDVGLLADGLVRPEQGDGSHFADMARNLVAAAIEVVVTQEEPERRNLVSVVDLLLSDDIDGTLQAWAENPGLVGHRPAQTAATILRAGDKERGGIQTSASKAFNWMESEAMRHFLARSTFRLDDLLDDKLDLFIAVPLDQIDRQAVFMRLFTNLVLGTVVRQDGRRKVKAPILLVLDEFVRMGRMEQVLNIANVAAGSGIEALFVTQDTGQVETAYGRNDARSIFGSCITKRLFNLNDIDTADWAARHLGENTVYSQQRKEPSKAFERQDLSYSEQRTCLMTAEQIMGMKADELLLLVGNRSPLKARQNRYYEQRTYRGQYDDNPLN